MEHYVRPRSLAEAVEHRRRGATVLAGATDYYPARVGRPLREAPDGVILDISGIRELCGLSEEPRHWRLGAATSWTTVAEAALPPLLTGLQQAAREVGGRQIQNRATIGGNLCNASPAADGVPSLLALEAAVELASVSGVRTVPLSKFITGPRRTVLAPDELLTAVLVPKPDPGQVVRSGFLKLGARTSLVISIVMAAAVIEARHGRVSRAQIAVGAASPVAQRLQGLEAALVGRTLQPQLADAVASAHMAPLSPIDDVRASAAYRGEAALVLVRRLLARLGSTL
jgi:CO/xanthine dehydrogenase FAD-binding subunit